MSVVCRTEHGELRRTTRDGHVTVLLKCPGCGAYGALSDDQANGRISVDHTSTGCLYHETHDFMGAIKAGGGWVTE